MSSEFLLDRIHRKWQQQLKYFSQLLPLEGTFLIRCGKRWGKMIISQTVVELTVLAKTIENRVLIIHKMRRK